jgi:capsular polysaccharide biosynthesis protein
MELRAYWGIVRRRLWIIVGLLLVMLVSYALSGTHASASTYTANMRFVVGIVPEPSVSGTYTYDRYYTWLTAEYLIDDYSEVVKSQAFAQDVATEAGLDVPVGAIQGATSAGKLHRILTVTVTWHDPQELAIMANAVSAVLQQQSAHYFAQLSTGDAVISLIDPPVVRPVAPSLRQRLDLPLRLLLGLAAGIGLVFLLDYLDDSIRHQADLEALGVVMLAQVPPTHSWVVRLWRRRAQP